MPIVVAGCESQAAQDYREQGTIQKEPAQAHQYGIVGYHIAQPGSPPEWLLIVPPEEPGPFGQTRVMTEAPPASGWSRRPIQRRLTAMR